MQYLFSVGDVTLSARDLIYASSVRIKLMNDTCKNHKFETFYQGNYQEAVGHRYVCKSAIIQSQVKKSHRLSVEGIRYHSHRVC